MNDLQTERVVIRAFLMEDLEAVHRILDLDLRWSGRILGMDERQHRLRYQIDRTSDKINCLYGDRAIVLQSAREVIGMTHFQSRVVTVEEKKALDLAPDALSAFSSLELDVGYALATAHQRQGYATEAVQAMVDYAFGHLRMGRVFADTGADNVRSVALMKRLGMAVVPLPRPGWPNRVLACLGNRHPDRSNE